MIYFPLVHRAAAARSDLPAVGTIALAAVTVAAIIITIVITIQDRRRAGEREQYAEAYRIQVLQAERDAGPPADSVYEEPTGSLKSLGAVIINRSAYTITSIEARRRISDGTVSEFRGSERVPGTRDLDPKLSDGMTGLLEALTHGDRLALWDLGLRFYSDARPVEAWYPVVRWTDRWGARWKHRRGEVRKIAEGEPWSP